MKALLTATAGAYVNGNKTGAPTPLLIFLRNGRNCARTTVISFALERPCATAKKSSTVWLLSCYRSHVTRSLRREELATREGKTRVAFEQLLYTTWMTRGNLSVLAARARVA